MSAAKPADPQARGASAGPATPAAAVAELLAILDLEKIEENIYRGISPQVGWQRVFGGLVVSQALVAAARTVEGRPPHSLHGYFLLPGDPNAAIVYQVDRLRDGGSFTTRRCTAVQHGRAIFALSASFQTEEQGLEHFEPMPDAPAPETLADDIAMLARAGDAPSAARRWFEGVRAIERRPVDLSGYLRRAPGSRSQAIWLRAAAPLPTDPALHRAILAYMSDMPLLDTALIAHGASVFDPRLQVASLDHALWLHRPFRADDWLLFVQDTPNANGSRGLARGLIYARDGRLVASTIQEGLMRLR